MQTPDPVHDALARGDAARRRQRFEEALAAFDEAVAAARGLDRPADLARALTRRAQIHRDTSEDEAALADQAEAAGLYRGLDDPAALAHAVRHQADILSELERHAEAGPLYAEMTALYDALPQTAPLERVNALRSVALHAEHLGERDRARSLWRDVRARYAALDALFLELTGRDENPGVMEADRRLAGLGA
jgi:tetratricopeptide (TPR) repeat protein